MAKEGQTADDWLGSQGLSEYNIVHIQGTTSSAAQVGRTGALDAKAAENDDMAKSAGFGPECDYKTAALKR